MKKEKIILALIVIIIFSGILFLDYLVPNDIEKISEVRATVLEVDNRDVINSGLVRIGFQTLYVEVEDGKYINKQIRATNQFTGSLEIDNYFEVGDRVIISIHERNGKFSSAVVIDLYRQNWEFILFGIFVLALVLYAGYTGVKALFSFVASVYIIWNVLISGLLAGKDPLLLSSITLILLAGIIIFSIAGFTKKGIAAFAGSLSGLFVTIGITMVFGNRMGLEGMTAPFAQTLLFSGYMDLNIKMIFYASIIIGASGAAMDVAMDMAATMKEIKDKKPDIEIRELIQSGFNVGNAVIGTMTTTLLLAYSGGYLTMLMLFSSQHSSLTRIINFKMVASEILRILIGSIGLVLVAPITAIFAAWIYSIDLNKLYIFIKAKEYFKSFKI